MAAVLAAAFALLCILLLALSLYWFSISKQKRKKHLPPGPYAFPLVGNLLLLLGKLPHVSLLELSHKHGPVMLLKLGSQLTLVISSSDAAREVFTKHDLAFASRPRNAVREFLLYDGQDLVMAPYGQHWRDTRKLCMLHLLSTRQVGAFAPAREQELHRFLCELQSSSKAGCAVDMTNKLSEFAYNIMVAMVMNKHSSVEDEGSAQFRNLIFEGTVLAGNFHIGDQIPWLKCFDPAIPRMKEILRQEDEYLQKQIDEHLGMFESGKARDFVDVMISMFKEGHISEGTMKALVLDMIAGGTDIGVTLEWAMSELVQNPVLLKRCQQEVDCVTRTHAGMMICEEEVDASMSKLQYVCAAIKETLRLHPPAPLLVPHEAIEECQVQGYTIPAQTTLLVNVYAIGRDPSLWSDPLLFKPERFLEGRFSKMGVLGQHFELIPFGSGRRSCPGINLSMKTITHALVNLLHSFDWQATGAGLDMSEGFGFLFRAKPLKLFPIPR